MILRFVLLLMIMNPSFSFPQTESFEKRINNLSDLRLCMHFSGMKGPDYANMEIFKQELLEGKRGNIERIVSTLEAADVQARDFISREEKKERDFASARTRLKAIDPATINDPVMKDLVILLQR